MTVWSEDIPPLLTTMNIKEDTGQSEYSDFFNAEMLAPTGKSSRVVRREIIVMILYTIYTQYSYYLYKRPLYLFLLEPYLYLKDHCCCMMGD